MHVWLQHWSPSYASASALSLAMNAALRLATLSWRCLSVSLASFQRFLVAGFLCSGALWAGFARISE